MNDSTPSRKRFTRTEIDRLLDTDILAGQRWELIDGDLIDKSDQKPPHIYAILQLHLLLGQSFGLSRVLVQIPIEPRMPDLEWSLPEPDIAVVAENKKSHATRYIRGDELLLAIEVADTTVWFDAVTKRDLYARAGVPEYWVLDISARRLWIHRNLIEGRYVDVSLVPETGMIAAIAAPDRPLQVSAVLS